MRTIQDKEMDSEFISFPYPSSLYENGDKLRFEIKGLTNERSYEDRDVFVNISKNDDSALTFWLRGETAIDLGVKLINHGKFALESNRINHQAIHVERQFHKYLDDGIVEEIEFKAIDRNPVNYGDGFIKFLITLFWVPGKEPEYEDEGEFSFEKVIYWSPFEKEYAEELDYYTRGCSYSFIGYDHDKEVERFNEQVRLLSND